MMGGFLAYDVSIIEDRFSRFVLLRSGIRRIRWKVGYGGWGWLWVLWSGWGGFVERLGGF